ncbi:cellulose synthase complex outer membrane protein BcsC [Pseudomonas plecoglossicida]|uniref:cellulose synthase complex outer membrane protein BcsC n=1 Tax=Pseudomonas plecoglossicida TaxID=70775 RepID=UPI00048B0141|nr:cellulose synthase complex outer membrane protein BcsC [Pseudomonas plecoglossicida]GLR36592.1 cellulose biosynthesis protein BcsC [Pseudomonas plecoglossicida]
MFRMIGVLTLAALSCAVSAQPRDREEQRQWLLEQVRIGEALHRDDLVHDALARLRLLDPRNPDALLAALSLALREQKPEEAEQLRARIAQVAPGSRQDRQARRLLQLQQPEQAQRLQQARLMAVTGRYDEALVAYDQLFAGEPPSLELALDYWRVRGNLAGQRPEAIRQLQQLDRQYPGNAGLRQTLASWLFSEDRDSEALAVLDQLSRDPTARDAAAQREFDYLSEQPVNAGSVAAWQAFIRRYPASPLLPLASDNLKQQRTLVGDPAWQAGQRGQALLDQDRNAQAEAQLRLALRGYPDDASLHGALGVALMRQRRYSEANASFHRAVAIEQNTRLMSKWKDLEASSQYWGMLQKADGALAKQDLRTARSLYQQARRQRPQDEFALLGLADVSFAEGDLAGAERQYLQVQRMVPGNESAVRGLMRIYQAQSTDKAEAYLDSLPRAQQAQFASLRRSLELGRLREQGDAALQRQDWATASRVLGKAAELAPDEPWLAYQLASSLRQQGRNAEADAAFNRVLQRQPADPATRYAHGLYLESSDRDAQVQDTLRAVPQGAWTDDMRTLDKRVRWRMTLAQAQRLQDQGRTEEATAVLEAGLAHGDGDPDDLLLMADWAAERGDQRKALGYYQRVLQVQPQRAEARLGVMESWIADGDLARVRQALNAQPLQLTDEQSDAQRRLAAVWAALGEKEKAARLLEHVASRQAQPDPVLRRDAARLVAADDPQRALDLYAAAMADAQLLSRDAVAPRDDRALTYASRAKDTDDWLARGLRSDVDELYQQRNTSVTLMHDYGWRKNDGTDGISRLSTQTTLLHVDTPWEDGRAFARVERIGMDAGSFDVDGSNKHTEDFGSCQFRKTPDGRPVGCEGSSESANGGVLAVGWQNERWGFDLGTTQGFEVNNWLGGAIVNGDIGQVGWSLSASRRPMSNSLLSFGGTRDPNTNIRWGGVTANGGTLGLSWDQGGDHGVWASLGHHWLYGENVADNERTRIMAGYYRRVVERADERMRVGLTVMRWNYDKDLGGYSLGQGGYYSPERYESIGVPVSYAWRNYDWSFLLESSVSWSRAHSGSNPLYPDSGVNRKILEHFDITDISQTNINEMTESSDSTGLGYRLHGAFERRLNDRWALGGGFDWQHSDDYTPSHAMLYVRYLFEPWRGNLALPVTSLEPYSEWR